MNFDGFVNDIIDNQWKVHGVEVYKDDVLAHSWGDTVSKFPIYSATKTVLSIALGIANDNGLLNFDDSILDYMPKAATEKMADRQIETFRKLTLHRLMTMSVEGFPFRPSGSSYLDFSLSRTIPEPEKVAFQYSNIPAFLCGVALSTAINGDAGEFIKTKILDPLEITGAELGYSEDGYFYGASNMKLSVQDLSKIGYLLYKNGEYKGKQIVSPEYVKKATSLLQTNNEEGYGYFILKYKNGFVISGKWKQKCYILPEQKMIITHLADIQNKCEIKKSLEHNLLDILF